MDCLKAIKNIDFYSDGKTVEDLFNDIVNSDEKVIGISKYLKSNQYNNIKIYFLLFFKGGLYC